MKRNDIKTGVIYAVKRGGGVSQAVVLSAEGNYARPSALSHSTIGGRGIGGKHFLVLVSRDIKPTENLLDAASTIDVSEVGRTSRPTLPEGYSFDVVLPQAILGEYSEYERREEEARRAFRDSEDQARERREALRSIDEAAIDRFKRFPGMPDGFITSVASGGRIVISVDQLHALLDAAGADK